MSGPHGNHLVVVGATPAAHDTARELAADGDHVRHATTARAAALLLAQPPVDAAVLYPLDAASSSLDTLRALRGDRLDPPPSDCALPALIGDCTTDLEQLRAFDAGADDALPAQLGHLVLRARLSAVLRRSRLTTPERELARVAGLTIDHAARHVEVAGAPVALTPTGYRFLTHLAADPRRLHSHEQLLEAVWGMTHPVRSRLVATCATRVRHALRDAGARDLITSQRGRGYALLPPLAA